MLKLTLKKLAFDLIESGEKKEEYRKESKWILSRLNRINKEELKFVEFRNGYRKTSPSFIVEYKGWEIVKDIDKTYSNGLHVHADKLICIKLGERID